MSTTENTTIGTTATNVTAPEGKLLKMLKSDHEGIRTARAGNFNVRLKNSFDASLQVETEKLVKLETQKLEMSDFAPDSSTSLRVVDPAFNSDRWAKQYNDVTLAIKLQKEVVQNITDNIADLF